MFSDKKVFGMKQIHRKCVKNIYLIIMQGLNY
jgi:hypothetical protein